MVLNFVSILNGKIHVSQTMSLSNQYAYINYFVASYNIGTLMKLIYLYGGSKHVKKQM